MEFIKYKEFKDSSGRVVKSYSFEDTTPHPDGSDRGGSAVESYSFRVVEGKVTHEYSVDVDEPECFGLEQIDMTTKENALELLAWQRAAMLKQVADLDELHAILLAQDYEDLSEYEDEDEDGD